MTLKTPWVSLLVFNDDKMEKCCQKVENLPVAYGA